MGARDSNPLAILGYFPEEMVVVVAYQCFVPIFFVLFQEVPLGVRQNSGALGGLELNAKAIVVFVEVGNHDVRLALCVAFFPGVDSFLVGVLQLAEAGDYDGLRVVFAGVFDDFGVEVRLILDLEDELVGGVKFVALPEVGEDLFEDPIAE